MLHVGDMLEPKYGKFRNNFSQCDDNVSNFPQKQPLYLSQGLFLFVARMRNFTKRRNTDLDLAGMFEMIPDPLLNILHSAISHIVFAWISSQYQFWNYFVHGIPCLLFAPLHSSLD